MDAAERPEGCQLTVSLVDQIITTPDGTEIAFSFDPLRRHMLLNGLDAVGLTLQRSAEIREFELRHLGLHPWME